MRTTEDVASYSEAFELQKSLATKSLELTYERISHKSLVTICEEDARRTRVQNLILDDDNETLRERLEAEAEHAEALEQQLKDATTTFEHTHDAFQTLEDSLRVKTREVTTLKAELESMNIVSANSTKILTEKLALTHEVATLKPEIEHLRSQIVSYQTTLSEKLSLQREVATLQVELETEKRVTQRALAKQNDDAEQEAKAESVIWELRKELVKEKRDRERAEKDALKASENLEGKKAVWEGKLEATKAKLQATKEQLKETRTELQQAKTRYTQLQSRAEESQKPPKPSRKRKAVQLEEPEVARTSGEEIDSTENPGRKRSKRVSSMPGDKSNFSITPFLNRTMSLAPDSPQNEGPKEGAEGEAAPVADAETNVIDVEQNTPTVAKVKKTSKRGESATRKPRGTPVLESTAASKTNVRASKAKSAAKSPPLSQVVEENDENDAPTNNDASPGPDAIEHHTKIAETAANGNDDSEPKKKKKRKLLGTGHKTLFDDEGGLAAAPNKSILGGAKLLPKLGRAHLGLKGPALTTQFSPLKKDRRSVIIQDQSTLT